MDPAWLLYVNAADVKLKNTKYLTLSVRSGLNLFSNKSTYVDCLKYFGNFIYNFFYREHAVFVALLIFNDFEA